MARPSMVLLSSWPAGMELPAATLEIPHPGLWAGEGKAGDGVTGLF